MSDFEQTEPVQVKHKAIDPDGIETDYWRNALYLHKHGGHHHVIYAGGTKEKLSDQQVIRKYVPKPVEDSGN